MLLSYASLVEKPRIFCKLTGLSLSEFERMLVTLRPSLRKVFNHRGRPSKLVSLEDKLILLLIYYRTYATHEFLGYLVGLDNSNVCRLLAKLEPVVAKKIHIKKDRTLTEDKITELLLDVTEQPIQRPQSSRTRKQHYSGKKKRTTQKIEIVMKRSGEIVNVSHSTPGHVHDFNLRKASDPLPPDPEKYVDLGYLGLDKLSKHVRLPHKKPKGGTLTKEQKQENRTLAKIRIKVEHKFAQLKKFRILADIYRNFRKKHHLRFNIIAGILNLQAGF